jgi:hypothetical protein
MEYFGRKALHAAKEASRSGRCRDATVVLGEQSGHRLGSPGPAAQSVATLDDTT